MMDNSVGPVGDRYMEVLLAIVPFYQNVQGNTLISSMCIIFAILIN